MARRQAPRIAIAFAADPSPSTLRALLEHIRAGERDWIDLKEDWPDRAAIAKAILALANSFDVGVLLIGVTDPPDAVVTNRLQPRDPSTVVHEVAPYLPSALLYPDAVSLVPEGQSGPVQAIVVRGHAAELPYFSIRGRDHLKNMRAYVRHGSSSEEATTPEVIGLVREGDEARRALAFDLEAELRDLEILGRFVRTAAWGPAVTFDALANRFHEDAARLYALKMELLEKALLRRG